MNAFKSFLSGIVEGTKFLLEQVWSGLKSVFGSERAKNITLAALKSAKELLATELGAFVQKVVVELEASALEGPDRLKLATENIKVYLQSQGKELRTDWIQWAIHTILIHIRSVAVEQAALSTQEAAGNTLTGATNA